MKLENSFEVPASPDVVWGYLLDVEQVAPCMPGAELTEVVDDRTWKGKVTVKLGPVTLAYAGTVVMEERDDDAHRAVLQAKGTETRGKGTARATVTAALEPASGGGTRAELTTDLTLSGAAAQLARGMLGDVSGKLTQQFADCLAQRLSQLGAETATAADAAAGTAPAAQPAPPSPAHAAAQPLEGLRLGGWAVMRAARRNAAAIAGVVALVAVVWGVMKAVRRR